MSEAITAAVSVLKEAGYLVFKVPPCRHGDKPHAPHVIVTRSARCEGVEPFPHGVAYVGGLWMQTVACLCGKHFNTDPEHENSWSQHAAEVGCRP